MNFTKESNELRFKILTQESYFENISIENDCARRVSFFYFDKIETIRFKNKDCF